MLLLNASLIDFPVSSGKLALTGSSCLPLFNTAVSPTSGTSQLLHILLKSARDYPVLLSASTGSLGEAFLGFECLLTTTVWAPPPTPMGRNTLQHPSVVLDTTFLFM